MSASEYRPRRTTRDRGEVALHRVECVVAVRQLLLEVFGVLCRVTREVQTEAHYGEGCLELVLLEELPLEHLRAMVGVGRERTPCLP